MDFLERCSASERDKIRVNPFSLARKTRSVLTAGWLEITFRAPNRSFNLCG